MFRSTLICAGLLLATAAQAHQDASHGCELRPDSDLAAFHDALIDSDQPCLVKVFRRDEIENKRLELRDDEVLACDELVKISNESREEVYFTISPGGRACYEVHLEGRKRDLDDQSRLGVSVCRFYSRPITVCARSR